MKEGKNSSNFLSRKFQDYTKIHWPDKEYTILSSVDIEILFYVKSNNSMI